MHFGTQKVLFATACAIIFILLAVFAPANNFSPGTVVVVKYGAPSTQVAEMLAEKRVIAHPFLLQIALRLSGSNERIQAGAYRFQNPQNLFTVTRRLITGAYDIPPVSITFPEGITVRDAGERVANAIQIISASSFISVAKESEGYLFPDTYFFSMSSDTDSIIKTMRENFDAKMAPFSDEIAASGHSISDIVIMASLVEKEARTSEVRRIVAGILWNRITRGMPLQVDAVFGYIFNRNTYSPSFDDLKVDSSYNTYTHIGLPPGPINNPGLDSILAVLRPTKTNYLYYLTDKNGVMHYATTYAGHQFNQNKYLK